MRLPISKEREDPRFDVRRARPEEFERVYDVVDAAFGRERPREQYDWLYRRNPTGTARCWITIERATGEIIKTGTGFPWPIWRGNEVLRGSLGGDAATLPHWQRKGLSAVRRAVRRTHPWYDEICSIAGPNQASRAVIRKSGRGGALLGRLRGAAILIRPKDALESLGFSRAMAWPVGLMSDAILAAGQRRTSWDAPCSVGRVEEIRRFTVDYDDVTERHMAWPKFWSPHNADFLNWRYLDHPVESYMGLALVEDERPTGYAVLRLAGEAATLSEFAVETQPRGRAIDLLRHAIAASRDAGCAYLHFFGSPSWRHWGLFRRVGFLPYRSRNHAEAECKRFEPEIHDLRNWQLMPGDRDYR